MGVEKIRKQSLYTLVVLIAILIISSGVDQMVNVSSFIQLMNVMFSLVLMYLFWRLRKQTRVEFRLYILFISISLGFTFLHLVFDILSPEKIRSILASSEFAESMYIDYLPHSIFFYLESIAVCITFIAIITARTSKEARNDAILAVITSTLATFLLIHSLINWMYSYEYYHEIGLFQVELFYQIPYVAVISLFFLIGALKRVLIEGRVYYLYLLGSSIITLWSFLTLGDFIVKNFTIPYVMLDTFHLIGVCILLYGGTYHILQNKTIAYEEYPGMSREFIYSVAIMLALAIIFDFFSLERSVYVVIGSVIIILMNGQRSVYIKKVEELSKEMLEDNQHMMKYNQNALEYIVYHDEITELPNRRKMFRDIESFIQYGQTFSLSILDIDRFKYVNDLFNHAIGDQILREFVQRVNKLIDESYISTWMYRTEGDEFVFLTLMTREEVRMLSDDIFKLMRTPFVVGNESIKMTVSIGNTMFPGDGDTSDMLFKHAILMLTEAKKMTSKKSAFYSQEINELFEKQLMIEKDMRKGLDQYGEFELYYQPQYTIYRELIGFEALIRWNHPTRGFISPADFIPIAEETGLIVRLGEWVLGEACLQVKRWQEIYTKPLKMSVNVSVRQLQQENFVDRVEKIMTSARISPESIMLEITETYPFYANEVLVNQIKALHKIGCEIAIDDFGTGFCSLTSLTKVPVTQIKIAREYVNSIGTNTDDEILLEQILDISKKLRLETIAEGVETLEQLQALIRLDCQLVQGYYFSRPLNHVQATELLQGLVVA